MPQFIFSDFPSAQLPPLRSLVDRPLPMPVWVHPHQLRMARPFPRCTPSLGFTVPMAFPFIPQHPVPPGAWVTPTKRRGGRERRNRTDGPPGPQLLVHSHPQSSPIRCPNPHPAAQPGMEDTPRHHRLVRRAAPWHRLLALTATGRSAPGSANGIRQRRCVEQQEVGW